MYGWGKFDGLSWMEVKKLAELLIIVSVCTEGVWMYVGQKGSAMAGLEAMLFWGMTVGV